MRLISEIDSPLDPFSCFLRTYYHYLGWMKMVECMYSPGIDASLHHEGTDRDHRKAAAIANAIFD